MDDVTIEGKAYVNGEFQDCCIGLVDGKISAIKKILRGDRHYSFSHSLILPAGVDVHVHFRDPGLTHKEDFSSGTLAAAYGGISCIFDMPNTLPQTTTPRALSDKIKSATKKAHVDFGVYAGITDNNIQNVKRLAEKCNGFKIYLGSTTGSIEFNVSNLNELLSKINSTDKPVLIHAEDEKCLIGHKTIESNLANHLRSRPSECEETAIRNILKSSKNSNTRVHVCHLSSCEGLELLRNRSKNISCGVTPHHLLLSLEKKLEPQTRYKVNPPIRTSFDREALFDGIKNGFIDVLESDHAPHTLGEKDVEFNTAPCGLPGVETMFPLLLAMVKREKLSFQRLISALCEKPAELLGVSKGRIKVGMDADLIVANLKEECKIKSDDMHSKCGWNPYEGFPAVFPSHVFVRGEKLIEEHEIQVSQGFGRFVGD